MATLTHRETLDNSQLIAAFQQSTEAMRRAADQMQALGGQMRSAGAAASSAANGGMNQMASAMRNVALQAAATALAFVSVGRAIEGFKGAISSAAQMEDFVASFKVLLGSTAEAKKRLQELTKFAASTPFQLPEIVATSRLLQTFGGTALATGKSLTLLGDLASGTGQPVQELAVHFGRLYDGLMNGRPVGESLARLQEVGGMLASTRTKIEQMQASGQKGTAVWAVATADFARYSGMMEAKSSTWNGLWSNLEDGIDGLSRAFGQPIMDSLKPMLSGAVDLVGSIAPAFDAAGQKVAFLIDALYGAFKAGQLGEIISLSLQVGFGQGLNYLVGGLSSVGQGFSTILRDALAPDVWNNLIAGMGSMLVAAAAHFGAALIDAFRAPVEFLATGLLSVVELFRVGITSLITLLAAQIVAIMDGALSAVDAMTSKMSSFVPGVHATHLRASLDPIKDVGQELQGMSQAESYNSISGRAKNAVNKVLPDSAGTRETANKLGKDGADEMRDAIKMLGPTLEEVLKKGIKPANAVDVAGLSASLDKSMANFAAATKAARDAANKETPGPKKDGTPAAAAVGMGKVVADSLAQIGGGGNAYAGSGNPLVNALGENTAATIANTTATVNATAPVAKASAAASTKPNVISTAAQESAKWQDKMKDAGILKDMKEAPARNKKEEEEAKRIEENIRKRAESNMTPYQIAGKRSTLGRPGSLGDLVGNMSQTQRNSMDTSVRPYQSTDGGSSGAFRSFMGGRANNDQFWGRAKPAGGANTGSFNGDGQVQDFNIERRDKVMADFQKNNRAPAHGDYDKPFAKEYGARLFHAERGETGGVNPLGFYGAGGRGNFTGGLNPSMNPGSNPTSMDPARDAKEATKDTQANTDTTKANTEATQQLTTAMKDLGSGGLKVVAVAG